MDNDSIEMLNEFSNLISNNKSISANSVLDILKKYASTVSVFDMMSISAEIIEENKYVQESYREQSEKSYVESFILRINQINADMNDYAKNINREEFSDAVEKLKSNRESLEESKSKFPLVGSMASLYTTFILEEPIHKVGTVFPGSLKVEEKNGKYYCPVRDANIDTPNAVCNICLAEQLDF